ncbi:Na-K-2Cl cotransporter 1 [Thecamonas trahens ATCC 50062]|uniref:Solute carrier family 12 member 3 n=1 Tax=Thecamonas trahens ATCC 50062 TaxID=461836 RepID=A0A0L0DG96_THETB|nr:Na-K-2Cl cotransporter 1 [Thecamonas trahens ATCC 50062]KNC51205.1 Na-K-2Cl cotransporter 1 [Thecamonas trahens ATCC 50062]|eukprot:XP_013756403.1 Na-K-2Cl cotransporter 1 [Thecamonas trahens ATCC 50062]
MSTMQKKEAASLASQLKAALEGEGVNEVPEDENVPIIDVGDAGADPLDSSSKLGWAKGVLIPCLLNIWGVIMFLRLGWCVGFAGAGQMTVIILLAGVVTTLTTLSLSAIATNGEVKAGGAYFLISRNLGPAWGGSIGVIFSFANAVAVAMYIVGFAETLTDIWGWKDHPFGSNALRVVGFVTLIILFAMCLYGVGWIAKLQVGLLVVLVAAMGSMILGALISGAWGAKPSSGFVGIDKAKLVAGADYGSESFFSIFAIFFPAATGIMAGANISGDLKRPSAAIPKGTLLAIGISTVVYIGMVWIIAAVSTREKLKTNTLIMMDISVAGPVIVAGIFAATLSSALASLVGAPRVLQAVCRDQLIPALNMFGKGRRSDDEPIHGYILVFFVAVACISIGDLNAIASLISQLFLLSYGFVNYATFAMAYSKPLGWRPGFVYYHWSTAAFGGILCLGVMFLVDWTFALVAFVICGLLYAYISYRDPDVNWGSVNLARVYSRAVRANIALQAQEPHVKNWRPQVLLLTGDFAARLALVKLTAFFTEQGVLFLGNIIIDDAINDAHNDEIEAAADWVVAHNVRAFSDVTIARSFRRGVRHFMLVSGLGRALRPNTLAMGFRHTWHDDAAASLEYVNAIRDAMDKKLGLMIIRNANLVDFTVPTSDPIDVYWLEDDGGFTAMMPYILSRSHLFSNAPIRLFSKIISPDATDADDEKEQLALLMRKLRITTSEINLLTTLGATPNPATTEWYARYELLTRARAQSFLDARVWAEGDEPLTVEELEQYQQSWTDYYLRLGELIHQNSANASAVFVSLRIPDNNDSALMYMSWLEAISHGMECPFFFVRGSHENVVTLEA